MSKQSSSWVRIRYLCEAALRSEVVVPLLVEELGRLVRFGAWAFAWANDAGQIVNSAYSPLRAESLRYFAEHFDHLARDCGYSVHDVMQAFPEVSNPRRTGRLRPDMDTTETWRTVWEPEGCWFSVIVVVRTNDARPLGFFQVFRPRDDVDFDAADEAAFARALPYLRRLLIREAARSPAVPTVQDGAAGVALFVDGEPRPGFVSDRAFMLSTQAFNDRLPLTANGLELVEPLQGLGAMYADVARRSPPSAVVLRLSNARGDFAFEWEPSARRGGTVWSVVIRHRIPARLRLVALPDGVRLSDRQLEVCAGLLDGESLGEIAGRIHVKAATLKDHTRQIYRKLGVGDRDALLRKLIG